MEIFVAEQMPEERDRKHLHFLAGKMEQENFLVFELLNMQPRWGKRRRQYRLALGLVSGLIFALASGLFNGFNGVILALGLLMGLYFGLKTNEILTYDIQIWRLETVTKKWKLFLFALSGGLILGTLKSTGLGLFSVLFSVLIVGYVGGFTMNHILYVSTPYQRFWATFQLYFWGAFVFLLFSRLGIYIVYPLEENRYWAQSYSIFRTKYADFWLPLLLTYPFVFIFCFYEISQLPQHVFLRLVLYLEGKMPLRVVSFMDRMSEQLIFEDNRRTNKKGKKMRGATWRFRHKILQDYFAGNPS